MIWIREAYRSSLIALLTMIAAVALAGAENSGSSSRPDGAVDKTPESLADMKAKRDKHNEKCNNPWKICEGCDEEGCFIVMVDEKDPCPEGTEELTGSKIDIVRRSHTHDAIDYLVQDVAAGCSPCGSANVTGLSGLPELSIHRYHRFRQIHYVGSFGPGVFSNYDEFIELNGSEKHFAGVYGEVGPFTISSASRAKAITDKKLTASDSLRYVRMDQDTDLTGSRDRLAGALDYADTRFRSYRHIRLYRQAGDGSLIQTGSATEATIAIATDHLLRQKVFELFQASPDVTNLYVVPSERWDAGLGATVPFLLDLRTGTTASTAAGTVYYETSYARQGRLIALKDKSGNAIDIRYQVAAAVDPAWRHPSAGWYTNRPTPLPVVPAPAGPLTDPTACWRIDRVVDPLGRTAVFTYDAVKRYGGRSVVSRIQVPGGTAGGLVPIDYRYDLAPQLLDAQGATVAAVGQWTITGLSDVTYPDGATSSFRVFHDPVAQHQVVAYDDAGTEGTHRRKQVGLTLGSWTDPVGGTVSAQAGQMLSSITNGMGEFVFIIWNETVSGIDATVYLSEGRLMRYLHSGGYPIATQAATAPAFAAPLGTMGWKSVESYGHDTFRRVTKVTDANGRSTSMGLRSSDGAVEGRTKPDGSKITAVFDPRLKQPTLAYDSLGRASTTAIDAIGRMTARTTGLIRTSTGALISGPDTAVETWGYNARGQLLFETSPLYDPSKPTLHRTDYVYDAQGFLREVHGSADDVGLPRPVTTFAYDSAGRVSERQQPDGQKVQFTYDARNRPILVTYGDGSSEGINYATTGPDAGMQVSKSDRNGNVIEMGYDLAGRLISTTKAAGTTLALVETLAYGWGTNVVLTHKIGAIEHRYGYDERMRQVSTSSTTALGLVLKINRYFDMDGQLVRTEDAYGRRTFFAYDVNGRPARTISELIPGGLDSDSASAGILSVPRRMQSNPSYSVEDTRYDREGQVVARIDARGIATAFGYDPQGRMTIQMEAMLVPSNATEAARAVLGSCATTAETAVTRFEYDRAGNRTAVIDPRGIRTETRYGGRNLVASVTQAVGLTESATTSQTYTLNGKVKTSTDADDYTTTYTYTPCCDRLQSVIDPSGAVTSFGYDHHGNRTSVTDSNGLTTVTAYDSRHRVSSVTNAAGETTNYRYDDDLTDGVGFEAANPALAADLAPGGRATAVSITSPVGPSETNYEIRDVLGRIIRRVDPLGHVTKIAYDAITGDGLVATTTIDPILAITTHAVDGAGLVRWTTDAIGATSTAAYDPNGNRVAWRDSVGVGMDCTVDLRNRDVACMNTIGARTTKVYDPVGNVIATTDALQKTEYCFFDGQNRKWLCIDRIGASTTFAYSAAGDLVRITDAEGGTTEYDYDERHLLVEEVFPIGQQGRTRKVYTYDPGRRLIARQVGIGVPGSFTGGSPVEGTSYAYDQANRLITRGYDDGLADSFGYDPASRLTSAASARYQTSVARFYDADSRLTGEIQSQAEVGSWSVGYAYDAANRQVAVTYPDGSQVARNFDLRGQLTSASFAGSVVAGRQWDAAGRLIQTTYGNGVIENRTYTPGDHTVATIKATGPGGAAVTDFTYTYDALKRKTAEIDPILAGQTFGYDAQSRLTVWTATGGVLPAGPSAQTWDLSPVGDWRSTTIDGVTTDRTHTKVHEIATIGGSTLGYDFKGNLTRDDRGQRYAWDPENRLTAAWVPAGPRSATDSRPAVGADARYLYDALGRRVAKVVNGMRTVFVHDGAQVITEEIARDTGAPAPGPAWNAPASGGILTGMSTTGIPTAGQVLRINFQPTGTPVPAGFLADTGAASATRGALHFGWSWSQADEATVTHLAPSPEWDTFIETTASGAAWAIDLPNGTYPITIVSGDADFDGRTNAWILDGGAGPTVLLDQDPGPGGYPGDFDVWATAVTVSNGRLTIRASGVSVRPSLCFLEIAAAGSTLSASAQSNGEAIAENQLLGASELANAISTKRFVYSTRYLDEILLCDYDTDRLYSHLNRQYSLIALSDVSGTVVERFAYDAHGNPGIAQYVGSSGWSRFPRGFTGYLYDSESSLYFARNRMYSNGKFLGRDKLGYTDGFNLYHGYFSPNSVDPHGTEVEPSEYPLFGQYAHGLISLNYFVENIFKPVILIDRSLTEVQEVAGINPPTRWSRRPDISHVRKTNPCVTEMYEIKPDTLGHQAEGTRQLREYIDIFNNAARSANSKQRAEHGSRWPTSPQQRRISSLTIGRCVVQGFLHYRAGDRKGLIVYKLEGRINCNQEGEEGFNYPKVTSDQQQDAISNVNANAEPVRDFAVASLAVAVTAAVVLAPEVTVPLLAGRAASTGGSNIIRYSFATGSSRAAVMALAAGGAAGSAAWEPREPSQ